MSSKFTNFVYFGPSPPLAATTPNTSKVCVLKEWVSSRRGYLLVFLGVEGLRIIMDENSKSEALAIIWRVDILVQNVCIAFIRVDAPCLYQIV